MIRPTRAQRALVRKWLDDPRPLPSDDGFIFGMTEAELESVFDKLAADDAAELAKLKETP